MSDDERGRTIADVLAEMDTAGRSLPDRLAPQREFLSTYARTTVAVNDAVAAGVFVDPGWVERWDVAFASLYLVALRAESDEPGSAPRPWRLAFAAPPELPALRHVLLGMNAHINYDLPQALLAVIDDADFADPGVLGRRETDHERIDGVLSGRVSAENRQLAAVTTLSILDRLLGPLNKAASRRFLREARHKVWLNTRELQQARTQGPERYAARLAELEVLSAAKIADLLAPGQVLLRLAVSGFGVVLPPV